MNNSEWGNPNDFFMTFRCMKRKYARPFFKNGRIKFSTPASWVEYARQHGTGRGDHFEGSFATFNSLDLDSAIPLFKKYSRKYPDIVSMTIGSRCYLKRKRDMELPCLCMYYLKNKNFPCPDVEGIHELERTIPASYFRDFADNLPPEAIERLPEDDRPAIVMISDYPEFKRRLIEKLLRFLYNGIIIKHQKTEPTYTKTSLFLCEKRRFFMARREKGVVPIIYFEKERGKSF